MNVTPHFSCTTAARAAVVLFRNSLFTFAITPVAPNVSFHMNNLSILDSVVFLNTVELSSFTVLCHSQKYLSFAGNYTSPSILTVKQR